MGNKNYEAKLRASVTATYEASRGDARKPHAEGTLVLGLRPARLYSETMDRPWLIGSALILAAGLALWYVWQGWQLTELSSKVIASRLERDALLAQRDRLKLEVMRFWSLENIEKIAKERLGMKKIPPGTLKLPWIDDSR